MFNEKDFDNTQNNNEQNLDNSRNTGSETSENVQNNAEQNDIQQNDVVIDAGNLFEEDDVSESTEQAPDSVYLYTDGTSYKNQDDNAGFDNGYEWDAQNTPTVSEKEPKVKKTKKDGSSQRGFRVFLGIVLTVFTLSLATLTAMVAEFVIDGKQDEPENINIVPNTVEKYDKAPADVSNYVVYDSTLTNADHLTLPQIAAKCSVSSVGIISQVEVSYNSFPFSFVPSTGVSQATGSGFIYSQDGYIITNHHVIDGATDITVVLHDKTELKAELVGSDELSDIAVLKVKPEEGTTLVPMEIGNSDELVVGETVVAIGCPAGIEFMGTVTDGIVSSINRDVKITDNYGTTEKTMTLIQTNATINHGNSGGPLINTRGQIIGINTLKLTSDYEGIGFSIPMNGAMPIIRQLIEHGKVIERTQDDFAYGKGIIGITGSAVSQAESEQYGIPMGVLVVQIDRESSAAKEGLRRGDIITHFNGKKVETVDDINAAKGSARPGEQVTVTVYRDSENNKGESFDITFELGSAS